MITGLLGNTPLPYALRAGLGEATQTRKAIAARLDALTGPRKRAILCLSVASRSRHGGRIGRTGAGASPPLEGLTRGHGRPRWLGPERRWSLALRVELKPGERMLGGGAAVRTGATRAELFNENDTPLLRELDVLRPDAVRTPGERIHRMLRLMSLDDHAPGGNAEAYPELTQEVLGAAPSCAPWVKAIDEQLDAGRLFRALRSARRLIAHEREHLSHAS